MSIFNSTDKIYHLLLMKEMHTLGQLSDEQYADLIKTLWEIDVPQHNKNKLYIRIYADDEPSVKAEKLYQICGETQNKEVAKWLKEYFPSAEAEWIPVSEGLPDAYVPVLVSDGVSVWEDELQECYEDGKTIYWWDSQCGFDFNDTAWMPLPKPYRENGEA